MPISSSGATTARSSTMRIRNTTTQRDRDDQPRVAGRGLAQVVLDRGRAADERLGAAGALGRARGSSGSSVEGLGRVGVGLEDRLQQRRCPASRPPARPPRRPRRPATARAHRVGAQRSRTMMSVGAFAPPGNASSSSSWPSTDSTSSRNELPCVSPVEKFSRPSDSTSSSPTTPTQTLRGRAAIAVAEPRARRPWVSLRRGRVVARDERPERPSGRRSPAARAGTSASRSSPRRCRARRPARGPRAVDLGERQAQQRRDDGQAGGEDRRAGACAARAPSPRGCPRGGAAPRGSGRRAAARSRCPRRARGSTGSPTTAR